MPRILDPSTIRKGSGMANQSSVDANSFTDELVEGQTGAIDGHINAAEGAHAATAISTTGSGGQFDGDNVQSNLDEISALIPARPPTLGNFRSYLSFSGISDWGALKLRDGGFVARGDVIPPDPTDPTNDFFVYGEFWWPPYEAQNIFNATTPNPPGNVFLIPGNDPDTDPTFNLDPAGTADPTYTGGGPGRTHEGGFTRTVAVLETARIISQGPNDPVVLSGSLYPADRGVVALFHWPADGDVAAFLAQPLTTRVIAALLCGQGFNDGCDGDAGGIFSEGSPDVFAFPGRATGQFDLVELHTGINNQTGGALPGGALPGAGQVRLGTDPAAGPVVAGGIPILGGTTISTGGGNDNNYFMYRLPYLEDYTSATGLQLIDAVERPRYFEKPPVSLDAVTDLTQAGDYANFAKDYWTFQLARYRHRFLMALGADQGSYLFLHFRREQDFEAFARDGVMPDDVTAGYSLWSAGLSSYINPESVDNLVDTTGADPLTSSAYHVVRGAVFEDLPTVLVTNTLTYTFDRQINEVMSVSGVQYFLPNGTGIGTSWQIDALNWSVNNLWANGYLLGSTGGAAEVTEGLWHRNPVVLYLGAGTASSNVLNGVGPGFTGTAFYQRVDFEYVDLDLISGPFSLAAGPAPADSADIVLVGADTAVRFSGDATQCHFWQDARVRAFARKPLTNDDPAASSVQYLFPNPAGVTLLLHTTSQSPTTSTAALYGNFKTNLGDFPPRASLETARKDVEERFYDEVYRVADGAMITLDPTYNVGNAAGNLVGPGMPFAAGPIELPVRFASTTLVTFGFASYLRTDLHREDLAVSALVETEAQVSGLPDRNPPATDGVENPVPFSGMLCYPQLDYTVGFRPSVADLDTTTAQPDYSVIVDPERVYLRVFDAAYDNDASPEIGVVGQPFLTFRIDGLELADFGYVPPGPGTPEITIEIKIPGWTTWMDLGRTDGDGPSKQDALLDGAGCQILGPSTLDGRDAATGTVFAQVRVNVGPAANVFANSGATTAPVGVAPVMVRVRIRAAGASLNFTQGGATADSDVPRALTGITLLRHSNGAGPTPYGPPTFP